MFSHLLVGVICLMLAEEEVASNVTDSILDIQTFEEFKREFNKSYENETLEAHRKQCFEETLRVLDSLRSEHPKMGFGINPFSDLCEEEFTARYNPMLSVNPNSSFEIEPELIEGGGDEVSNGEDSLDYRQIIPMEVYKQGHCHSCYVFSAVGVLEAHLVLHRNLHVILSKQQSMDCANIEHGFTSLGCVGGGHPRHVLEYIKQYGTLSEEEYHYLKEGRRCQTTNGCNYHLKDCKNFHNVPDEIIKNVLKKVGPVSAVVNVDGRIFREYTQGIITDLPYNQNPNHAVMIVGYSRNSEGIPYWICKNSWGTKWGYGGYFYLLRGVNMRGINTEIIFPIL